MSALSPLLPWKCETPLLPQIPADLTHDSAAFGGKEVALQRSPAKGKFTRRPGLDHIWPGVCLFNLGVKKKGFYIFKRLKKLKEECFSATSENDMEFQFQCPQGFVGMQAHTSLLSTCLLLYKRP